LSKNNYMKYKLETLLAVSTLKKKILDIISNAKINEDDLSLEFEVDFKSAKGKYKKDLASILWGPIDKQYETLIAAEMLAEGYMCIPMQGGWIVKSPTGEEYQLTENSCTCRSFLENSNGPCKHLSLKDFTGGYRARINKYKIDKGYK
jgi:SWIM zinc finger